jgi:hypothetical protein
VIGGGVVHCWKQKLFSCFVLFIYLFILRVGDAMNGGDEEIRWRVSVLSVPVIC